MIMHPTTFPMIYICSESTSSTGVFSVRILWQVKARARKGESEQGEGERLVRDILTALLQEKLAWDCGLRINYRWGKRVLLLFGLWRSPCSWRGKSRCQRTYPVPHRKILANIETMKGNISEKKEVERWRKSHTVFVEIYPQREGRREGDGLHMLKRNENTTRRNKS